MSRTVAALFVVKDGVYYNLENVDPWSEDRDARLYDGPHVVIAHPPCERWGRYWSGGPNPKAERRQKGDDGGCFASAIASVRKWGGVLEHPEATHAWPMHGIAKPPRSGGWVEAGDGLGWTCCVEQGHYGHRARKATWLYVCSARASRLDALGSKRSDLERHDGEDRGLRDDVPRGAARDSDRVSRPPATDRGRLPDLIWGPSSGQRLDEGFHNKEERENARAGGARPRKRLSAVDNLTTPIAFRDVLLKIAKTIT